MLEAHGILENALGAEHERTIGTIKSLADLYDAWGKPESRRAGTEWRAELPPTPSSTDLAGQPLPDDG